MSLDTGVTSATMEKQKRPERPERPSWINTLTGITPPPSTDSSEDANDADKSAAGVYWNDRPMTPPRTPSWLREPIEPLQMVDCMYGSLHESAHRGITQVSLCKTPGAFVRVLDENMMTFASVAHELGHNPSTILKRFHPGLSEFDNLALLALLRPIREQCQFGTAMEHGRQRVATLLVMLVLRNREVSYHLARIAPRNRWRLERLTSYLTWLHGSGLLEQAGQGASSSSGYVPLFLKRLKKTMAEHTQIIPAPFEGSRQS